MMTWMNKPVKLCLLTTIIRYVFSEGGKFYPQDVLEDCLYVLQKSYSTKKLLFQKKLTLIRLTSQKIIIGFLKMSDLNLKNMFVLDVMIY